MRRRYGRTGARRGKRRSKGGRRSKRGGTFVLIVDSRLGTKGGASSLSKREARRYVAKRTCVCS